MKNIIRQTLVCLLLILLPLGSQAKVRLPKLISDGMVLQRETQLVIWGWASPAEKITLDFVGATYYTKADKKGDWSIKLPALAPGGPFSMKINDIEIKNILIGDVWLCSGQSNMELPVRRVLDLYNDEIKTVNNQNIRIFRSSDRKDSELAQPDFKDGSWLPATQENIYDFSAIAYFFAAQLNDNYKIPVGLISTAIGGSPAESWLSDTYVKRYLDSWLKDQAKADSARNGKPVNKNFWFEELNHNDRGLGKFTKADVDVADWPEMSLPGYWSEKGADMRSGSIWFCREFDLADSLINKDAVLRLGRIVDSDSAFLNGTFIGTTSYQYPPRIYRIPAGSLKAGKNKLMLRVICQSGKGGFVEEKPYELRLGRNTIDLTGDWKYNIGSVMKPDLSGAMNFRPGGLYNSLLSPIINMQLKGVIWYQGESNTSRAKEYGKLFIDLINDWRYKLGIDDLPFLFVQLANLGIAEKQPVESGWAELRNAQRQALQLPNTGMAVSYDIGEWNDIHPLNKKEVARRLALEAASVAYHNNQLVSSGPLYDSMEIEGNSIVLTFKSVGSGLFANSRLDGFQIKSNDGKYVWANATVLTKNKVRVWNDSVTRPEAVRYAWEDNPAGANLKNKEGLPASTFSTEK